MILSTDLAPFKVDFAKWRCALANVVTRARAASLADNKTLSHQARQGSSYHVAIKAKKGGLGVWRCLMDKHPLRKSIV